MAVILRIGDKIVNFEGFREITQGETNNSVDVWYINGKYVHIEDPESKDLLTELEKEIMKYYKTVTRPPIYSETK